MGICSSMASLSHLLSAAKGSAPMKAYFIVSSPAIDLLVCLALIVVPDPGTAPGKDGPQAQQPAHLAGLEDAALWIDQRNALAVEDEAVSKIAGLQVASARERHLRDRIEGGLSDTRV